MLQCETADVILLLIKIEVGENMQLPSTIQDNIGKRPYRLDDVGLSGSQVLLFDDMVLKIQPESDESKNELAIMQWLDGKLPVPKIICHEATNGVSYLLMTRATGKMSCDLSFINSPDRLVELLAEGLRKLWSVDITDCPCDASLNHHLAAAEYNVKNGLVDLENVEPETLGEKGFKDTEDLLAWLKANRPTEDPVLSHGDYCLPNIFANDLGISGYIDLGRAGIADRYRDIAICYRSLKSNLRGSYGGHPPVDFDSDELFRQLKITPDWDKIRYYILLDELF